MQSASFNEGALCIAPRSNVVAPDRVLSMGQKELNCALTQIGIAWNRTVLTLKVYLR